MTAHGYAEIRDGTSNTVLVAESRGATASCSDTNNTGVPGITELTISFRHERSGDRVLTTVTPREGAIEFSGRYEATMTFGRDIGSYEVLLDVELSERPGRSSGQENRDDSSARIDP